MSAGGDNLLGHPHRAGIQQHHTVETKGRGSRNVNREEMKRRQFGYTVKDRENGEWQTQAGTACLVCLLKPRK